MTPIYNCPVCQHPLQENSSPASNSLTCEKGHNFDRHKKGYINLLLAQHKKSKQPGDDSNMVEGRRSFLDAGHYNAFANKITELVSKKNPQTILDAGCGEGFYLNYILSNLASTHDHANIQPVKAFGFDISKPAIHAAAGKYKQIDWAVASSARAPYQTGIFDCIISVFSRVEPDEFSRLLKPGGIVIYAGPGENHLLSLRELIYSEVKPYQAKKHVSYFNDDFTLLEKASLTVPLSLNSNDDIMNLVSMTPHGQRINKDNANRLNATHTLNDEADFLLYAYQKIR